MMRVVAILAWVALRLAVKIAIESIVRAWLAIRPIRRWRRRKAMQSWADEHGGLPDEILEAFHEDQKEVPVLQGKLTYSGIAVLALGWALERFGVPVVAGELEAWVAALVAVVGGGAALYGRYRATKQ